MSNISLFLLSVSLFLSYSLADKSLNVVLSKKVFNQNLVSVRVSIDLDTDRNVTLIEVLKRASMANSAFSFTGKSYENLGFYVQSIGGLAENLEYKFHWLIYESTNFGDTQTQTGISSTVVSNGQQYLFWYKFVDYDSKVVK